MLGGSKVTSGHVPLIPLDDEHVGLSNNGPYGGSLDRISEEGFVSSPLRRRNGGR